jgi:drug/metabolite transporter (DMT)-like permease
MKKNNLFFQLLSCFFFSLLGLQIKFSADHNSIETIVFYRSLIGTIVLYCLFIFYKKKLTIIANKNIKFHILRSFFGVLAMYFGYKALTLIPLSLASTIGFTKVFFASLMSWLILKEKPKFKNFSLVLLGFSGVYLITLPSTVSEIDGVILSLLSSIFVSGGIITVSYLTKKETTMNILIFHSAISSILTFLIFFDGISFDIKESFYSLFFLTITALIGQYFNIESYRNEKASSVILVSYTRIIFSTALGFFFFNEKVSFTALSGILIIIVTTFFVQKLQFKKN